MTRSDKLPYRGINWNLIPISTITANSDQALEASNGWSASPKVETITQCPHLPESASELAISVKWLVPLCSVLCMMHQITGCLFVPIVGPKLKIDPCTAMVALGNRTNDTDSTPQFSFWRIRWKKRILIKVSSAKNHIVCRCEQHKNGSNSK